MNFSASATHCSFSNLCSLHFGGISEGAQMISTACGFSRFLSHPVQVGGDDVNVKPACTLCHLETHEQSPVARVEFRFALDEHLEVGPVALAHSDVLRTRAARSMAPLFLFRHPARV